MLMAPPPATKEEYFERFAKTWKILRVGSFPEDEALARARAERTFERASTRPVSAGSCARCWPPAAARNGWASVKAPTLVIHGTVDPLVRPRAARTPRLRSRRQLVMIEGMGHALPDPNVAANHRRHRQARPWRGGEGG